MMLINKNRDEDLSLDLSFALADAALSKLSQSQITEAADCVGIDLVATGSNRRQLGFYPSQSGPVLDLHQWIEAQRAAGAQRIFAAPRNQFIEQAALSAELNPPISDWDEFNGRVMVVQFQYEFAIYLQSLEDCFLGYDAKADEISGLLRHLRPSDMQQVLGHFKHESMDATLSWIKTLDSAGRSDFLQELRNINWNFENFEWVLNHFMTLNSKREIQFQFLKKIANRPSLTRQTPAMAMDQYQKLLRDILYLSERTGQIRWSNNIRQRIAKMRIAPGGRHDFIEALRLLNRPPDAAQLLDAIHSDYIFEDWHDHNQSDLQEMSGRTVLRQEVNLLIQQVERLSRFARDVCINAQVKGS